MKHEFEYQHSYALKFCSCIRAFLWHRGHSTYVCTNM